MLTSSVPLLVMHFSGGAPPLKARNWVRFLSTHPNLLWLLSSWELCCWKDSKLI
jgi:hypothetical protein